jgi:hypothetical protein
MNSVKRKHDFITKERRNTIIKEIPLMTQKIQLKKVLTVLK